jgi:1-phosphatidylinositol-3-phosphate 5-kinase
MDYSLLVGVDDEKHELVLGTIDFMRQYTWNKHLETWVKSSGIHGGPKNAPPTVISPMQYTKRYRKAMSAYFIVIPEKWMPAISNPRKSSSNIHEESQNAPQE